MHNRAVHHRPGGGRRPADEGRRRDRGRDVIRWVRRPLGTLRALGLAEDTTPGAPLCRWRRDDLIVDVMPVDEHVLGFSNRWYPTAVEAAQTIDIGGHLVRIVTPDLFIATKLEAFHGRGGGDIVASHDLEDIIAVVDGRPEIVSEVAAASTDVRRYIASELRTLLDNRDFTEALGGFLLPDAASQGRRSLLEGRLRSLTLP